jgi:ferritin
MELFNPIEPFVQIFLDRLTNELTAFHFYRNASNYCANVGYVEFAEFFKSESKDEIKHATMIQDFLNDWGVVYQVPDITSDDTFEGLVDVITKAYQIEVALYKAYNSDATKAISDISAYSKILEMVEIQRSSVAEYRTLIDQLSLIDSSDKNYLYIWCKSAIK